MRAKEPEVPNFDKKVTFVCGKFPERTSGVILP